MARKTETITLSIQKGTKEQLEQVAQKLGLTWGDRPSISGLLAAIAAGEVQVDRPLSLTKVQLHSLDKAIKALIDCGQMLEAKTLMEFLLAYGNLETPFNQDLLQKINSQGEAWRIVINAYLEQKQPFYLFYKNSHNEQENYRVRYAEIKFHEKRLYLDTWCEEINEKQDFKELVHNRCFRLDRIMNILKYQAAWRSEGLDFLQVHLHFTGEMIKAYEQKLEDLEILEENNYLKVIKKVSNPFWLIREILAYGDNCYLHSPDRIKQKYRETLTSMLSQYNS